MIVLRELTAIVLWIVFLVLGASCIFLEFSWRNLIIAACCFAAAFFIWPSKKKGERSDDFWFFDVAEVLIEGPILVIAALAKLMD
ncbi:MAG TPA: hypothetical protein VIZ65_02900 [Cellvibrionaceae bacterium]